MKVEILKHPTEEDWNLCQTCTLVTVWKKPVKAPTDAWKTRLLKANHSPIRTLQFCFRLTDIPYWVSVHLVRHVHATPFVSTQRDDRQNAKFLMHDGSNLIWNSGAKAQDQMEFQKRVEQRIKQYVIARSNVTREEYDSKLRVEWYLFADEAKEKGFCDHILGVDCELDEIV